MMLSNTCQYAIRAIIYIGVHVKENKRIGIKAIAEGLYLPAPYLGKIVQKLTKNKLLKSRKGPDGGLELGRRADKISFYDIVEVIDGKELFYECLIGVKICENNPEHAKLCPFNKQSHKIRDDLRVLFQQFSIGQFVEGVKNIDEVLKL